MDICCNFDILLNDDLLCHNTIEFNLHILVAYKFTETFKRTCVCAPHLYLLALADLGGRARRAPPLRVQILLF